MTREDFVALLHALCGAGVMILALFTKGGFQASVPVLKPLGFALFAVSMLLFAISVRYLGEAFRGNVQPITAVLIRSGPYRWVRHPLYLSMILAILGLSLGMRSLWGLLATFGLFLPLTILRARREEAALRVRFGPAWDAYAEGTHFLIPLVY